VTSQDEAAARAALEADGFDVVVQDEETTDPNSDGIVLNQDPPGGTKAAPGTTVTIFVGRLLPTP
jgi:beta-lactam-binding protein with PASTA domain